MQGDDILKRKKMNVNTHKREKEVIETFLQYEALFTLHRNHKY